ncbi:hypothetical protein MIMGU_mgv1a014790mg [Erythranthe guttata]|uniref:Uncharacterized protein n=1 Tax=Erythranthe guttata TaxID=4155 RepID=A0A022QG04_ERYGU|nr:hypothetical protein MIMGU_mgv1a014790mg [Erythranthe guttata]
MMMVVCRHVMKSCRCRITPRKPHGASAVVEHPLDQRLTPQGAALAAVELAVAVEVDGEGLDVVVEAELAHGPQDVLGRDGLPLLALAAVVGFAGDEADVLRHAFLYRLLCVVRNLRMRRKDLAHDSDHVCYRHEPVLLADDALCVLGSATRGGGVVVVRLRRRQAHGDVRRFHICCSS